MSDSLAGKDGPTLADGREGEGTGAGDAGALEEGEQRFRDVLQGLERVAVQAYSPEGTITFWNRASEVFYGFGQQEALGGNLLELLHDAKSRCEERRIMDEALHSGALPAAGEVEVLRKDGSKLAVYASRVLHRRPGRPPEFFCFDVDISGIKRAEAELREHQDMIDAILETSQDWIWVSDVTGRHTYSNPAVQRILGYPLDEILTRGLDLLHEEHRVAAKTLLRDSVERRRGWTNVTFRWRHADGGSRYLQSSAVPLVSASGELMGFCGVDRDLTEQRRMDESLRQSERLTAIGQLAGGVAHDFNNMLTGISGSAALLARGLPADSPLHAEVSIIRESAQRAAELTGKLLAFSRKAGIRSAPFDAQESIEAAIALIERSIDPRIQIRTRFEADRTIVRGDPTLIQNAVLNLGVNARDAMPEGGALVFATREVALTSGEAAKRAGLPPADYLELTVTDTGVGIREEDLPRIFDPFFTTKILGKGTGLGLAAVYGTITEHGGSIEVESALDAGTTFRILLPLSATDDVAPELASEADVVIGTGVILVVDDEELIRATTRRLLEHLGYEVLEAIDGADAVEVFDRHHGRIDLVLMDLTMPRLSGKQAFVRIREIQPRVRVLFTSGFSQRPDITALIERGAAGFLEKPYDLSALSRAIADALG